MYKRLFQPITINKLTLKNRIAYPSLAVVFSLDRKITDRHVDYYREKARGGAGLVTFGPAGVDDIGSGFIAPVISTDESIDSFKRVADAIHEEGAAAGIQLFHAGTYAGPIMMDKKPPIGPSAVYSNYARQVPREMTIEDIQQVQESFIDAAVRAHKAGFDSVELIGSAGYLICQFLSPLKNQRTDDYGGSFENRLRFPLEIVAGVKKVLDDKVALIMRMAGNDFVPGSNSDIETPRIARAYQEAGVDALNVTGGWHEARLPQMTPDLPRNGFAYLAGNIRQAVDIPVIASNRITAPENAEKLLADGYADMANLGRVLIADPYWPNKAKAGIPEQIRPCIACLQGCMDNILSGKPLSCIVNPRAGYEGVRRVEKANQAKSVLVVGAGPAGLEAAVTAALAGHRVDLYEKQADIGGQLHLAAAPPHKQEILEIIRYYRTMLDKTGVTLHTGVDITADDISKIRPDHVILAQGAKALIPPIEGFDAPCVVNAWDLLRENRPLGKEVAVIGGGSVGLETAAFIAEKGTISPDVLHFLFTYEAASMERLKQLTTEGFSQVTVFEMLPKAGKDIGKSSKWVLMGDLARRHVAIKTGAKVLSLKNGEVVFEVEGERQSEKFDNIVLALGSKSVDNLSESLENFGIPFTRVGDCASIGKIDNAIHGGFLAAAGI